MIYLLDTNTLIEAKNRYYSMTICPGYWSWILQSHGQGVVARALVNALAHEKANLLAALRRTDVLEDPQESARIQRELVELETERRKLQGL